MPKARVALYCRVSTLDQSTELQLRDLTAYAQARGWTLHRIFEDKLTGTNDRRPAFQECMAEARARKFDVLLVWKLDRFGRSLKDVINKLTELSELGVEFVSYKEQIDLSTATGKLMTHLLAAFAEFEADLIRSRVRAGLANARAKGKQLGRTPEIDRMLVLVLRKQGQSLSEIASQLGVTKSAVSKTLKKFAMQGTDFTGARSARKKGQRK